MIKREKIFTVGVSVLAVVFVFSVYRAFFYNPKVVRTRAVEIVDGEGKLRALLGVSQEGTVAIRFYDETGKLRSSTGVFPSGNTVDEKHEVLGGIIWGVPKKSSPVGEKSLPIKLTQTAMRQ